ncbi:MAG: hypothetical protein GX556_09640 [Fibrobacter sp.]|nr:hypothetical protein [Fibrobacter sp.]
MKLRNVFMTAVACAVLVIAAGTNSEKGMDGSSDTSMGGNGSSQMGDTMSISGVVQELNITDSMLILQSGTGTDTLFITEQSAIDPQQIKQGAQVDVKYIDMQGRKEIIEVMPMGTPSSYKNEMPDGNGSGNGSGGEAEITGTIQSVDSTDSSIVVQSDSGTDTLYFDQDTKVLQDALQQGSQATLKYKMSGDRKVATKVSPASPGNGGSDSSEPMPY